MLNCVIFRNGRVLTAVALLSLVTGCHKNDRNENPPISIQSFSPEQGMAGDTVLISGANWSTDKMLDTVRFNGVTANIVSATARELKVVVPDEASDGSILVKTGLSSAISAKAFVVKPPELSSFAPKFGKAGDVVEITGNGFATNSKVFFGDVEATEVTYISRTRVSVKVPAGATTSKVSVLTHGKTVVSPAAFTVTSLEAQFSFTISTAIPGQAECRLVNQSIAADSYQWRIGTYHYDLTSFNYVFYRAGSYAVTLIARKGELADTVVKNVDIVLDNSLLAYYPFTSSLQNAVNGVAAIAVNATPTTNRSNYANSAYYFNGTDAYIKLPDGLFKSTGSSATVSLWFQAEDPVPSGVIFGYQAMEMGSTPSYFVPSIYISSTKQLYGKFWFGTSPMRAADNVNAAWHHLVVTGDGGGQQLYLDGVLQASSADGVDNSLSMVFNQLGGGYYGGGWPGIPGDQWAYFKGKIDDVRVYNRKLSASEVSALAAE